MSSANNAYLLYSENPSVLALLPAVISNAMREQDRELYQTSHWNTADIAIICEWPSAPVGVADLPACSWRACCERGGPGSVIVLESPDPFQGDVDSTAIDAWNQRLKLVADSAGAHFIPLRSKFQRWGAARCLAGGLTITERGAKAIATAILRLLSRELVSSSINARNPTLSCRATGRSLVDLMESDRESADALVEGVCSAAARISPRQFKRDCGSLCLVPSAADMSAAAGLLEGEVRFDDRYGWPPVRCIGEDSVDWACPGLDRTWQSMFLGLDFLFGPLTVLWHLLASQDSDSAIAQPFGAERLWERIMLVVRSFYDSNPPDAPMMPRAWHEGTASRRLLVLFAVLSCALLARRLRGFVPGSLALVALSIVRIAELLASEEIYIPEGNHGVRQDTGLYALSRMFPKTREAASWRRLALGRLAERQFSLALSADGVWAEHSVGYHGLIMIYIILAEDVASMTSDAEAAAFFRSKLRRMLPFYRCTLLADDTYPPIGDTKPNQASSLVQRVREYYGTDFDGLPRSGLFPDAGYMIARSTECVAGAEAFVAFYANLRSPKHKHADDLSLILCLDRKWWLVDGGAFNRETGDARRNAARSDPASHNTYRVNGAGYSFAQRTADQVGFTSSGEVGPWRIACGCNRLYASAEVWRHVAVHESCRVVVVIDLLRGLGNEPGLFEQFWHLGPECSVEGAAGSFLVAAPGQSHELRISADDCEDVWEKLHGDEGQPIGWLMTSWNQAVPTPVLRREILARRRWCYTLFSVQCGPGDTPAHIDDFNADEAEACLSLHFGGELHKLVAGPAGALKINIPGQGSKNGN
jgi:hypothetical protein